jgi:hypothetical protein
LLLLHAPLLLLFAVCCCGWWWMEAKGPGFSGSESITSPEMEQPVDPSLPCYRPGVPGLWAGGDIHKEGSEQTGRPPRSELLHRGIIGRAHHHIGARDASVTDTPALIDDTNHRKAKQSKAKQKPICVSFRLGRRRLLLLLFHNLVQILLPIRFLLAGVH